MNLLKLCSISILLTLSSCASYINKMHNQIDQENASFNQQAQDGKNRFDMYRGQAKQKLEYARKSSRDIKNLSPAVKRQYANQKRRYTADDIYDTKSYGSLWSGRGQNNFLFAKNNIKRNGDIVVIKVQDKLKTEISLELKRAFPPKKVPPKDPKKKEEEKKDGNEAASNSGDSEKVHDSISSVVVEEINKDYILLRGRKEVLFNYYKHIIEVQALVARRDIMDDDSVMSSKILESNVVVLR